MGNQTMNGPSADVTIGTELRDAGANKPTQELLSALFDKDVADGAF